MRKIMNLMKQSFRDAFLYRKRLILSVLGILIACIIINVSFILINYSSENKYVDFVDYPEYTGIYIGNDYDTLEQYCDCERVYIHSGLRVSNLKSRISEITATVYGVEPDFLEFPVLNSRRDDALNSTELLYGRIFTEKEYYEGCPYVYIEEAYAELLFEGNPLGKTIELDNQSFIVLGILKTTSSTKRALSNNSDTSLNIRIYMPYRLCTRLYPSYSYVTYIFRYDKHLELSSLFENQEYYSYEKSQASIQQQKNDIISDMTVVFMTTAIAMAVLEIIIVVFNLKERTSEIGIKRAIGATKDDICFEFILEIVIVGVISVLLGTGVSLIIDFFLSLGFYKSNFIFTGFLSASELLETSAFVLTIITIAALIPTVYVAEVNIVDVVKGD